MWQALSSWLVPKSFRADNRVPEVASLGKQTRTRCTFQVLQILWEREPDPSVVYQKLRDALIGLGLAKVVTEVLDGKTEATSLMLQQVRMLSGATKSFGRALKPKKQSKYEYHAVCGQAPIFTEL